MSAEQWDWDLVNVVTLDKCYMWDWFDCTQGKVPAYEKGRVDGEPCTGQDRWTMQLLLPLSLPKNTAWPIRAWLSHTAAHFSHDSYLRPRYAHLLVGSRCGLGNVIYCRPPVYALQTYGDYQCSPFFNTKPHYGLSRLSVSGPFPSSSFLPFTLVTLVWIHTPARPTVCGGKAKFC